MKFYNKAKLIGEINKNTILVGENGSGKTRTIRNFMKANKYNNGTIDKEIKVYFAGLENIKEDVDGAKAKHNSFLTNNQGLANTIAIPDELKGEQLEEYINLINKTITSEEKIIVDSLKIKNKAVGIKPFKIEQEIEFNGKAYSIKELPSGVRKLIHIYFSLRDIKGDSLVLLDEIDNMLHPSWIKLISKIIIEIFEKPEVSVIVSTHNPELIYLLSNYIEGIAIPNKNYDKPIYFDIKDSTNVFNEINKFKSEFAKISETKYLSKVKVKMSLQLARIFFTRKEEIILVEGITDQMYFKEKTNKLVISTFGYYQVGLYLSILNWLKGGYEGINIILDGDGNLKNTSKKNYKLKEILDNLKINNFFFQQDLERDLFGASGAKKIKSWEKFKLLEKNINKEIPPTMLKLKEILE